MTVLKYERGEVSEDIQERSLKGLDRALGWIPGSAQLLLDEGIRPREEVRASNQIDELIDKTRKRLEAIVKVRVQLEKLAVDPDLRAETAGLQADLAMDLVELQERQRQSGDE